MKLSEPKTARQRNEEFAKVTKKTVFVTNIYEHLPVDDTPLADDDEDEEENPLIKLPQKRRKPAKTKKTKKPQTKEPRYSPHLPQQPPLLALQSVSGMIQIKLTIN